MAAVTTVEASVRYQCEAEPYSNHTLLLAGFPPRGNRLRALAIGSTIGDLAEVRAERGLAVTAIDFAGVLEHRWHVPMGRFPRFVVRARTEPGT